MGRGFFSGILWGGVVGLLAIALASQLTRRHDLSFPEPEAAEIEVPGGTEFDQARPETDPVVPKAEDRPAPDTAPETVGTPSDAVASAPTADTAPAAAPTPSGVASNPAEPQAPPQSAGVDLATSDPQAGRPATPAAPAASAPPEPAPSATATTGAQPVQPQAGDAPAVSASGDPATGSQAVAALPSAGTDAPPAPSGSAPLAPVAGQDAPAAPAAPDAPASGAASVGDTGLPQPGFSSTPDVTTDRLPRIGDGAGSDSAAADPEAEGAVDPDAPAILRFAAPFENPDGKPVISIVLMHDGPGLPDTASGLDLPVPVTFAVRASDPAAANISRAYRSAGREVVMVPSLPPGATPADVEVALQSNFAVIPQAVAIMDDPTTGFQSERMAVSQVVDVMADAGLGIVTFPRGLNTAQQLADRAGVPARPVFRMLDEAEEASADIQRTMDRAAFRARQEGVILLVGHTRPETVAAVLEWSIANAGGSVLVAPVSAALLAR